MNEKYIQKLIRIVEESDIESLEVSSWGHKVRITRRLENASSGNGEGSATRVVMPPPAAVPPAPQPEAEWKTLDINRLTRFFRQPIAFLLKERLGIVLQAGAELLDESEPFEVQGLDRYQLNQTLVDKSLQGGDLEAYKTVVRATGQLPYGQIGDYVYSQLTEQVQPFVEQIQQVTMKQKKMETVPIDLTVGDMRITGRLGRLWRDHLVHYRCSKLKAKDFIQLWIHHLILNRLQMLL